MRSGGKPESVVLNVRTASCAAIAAVMIGLIAGSTPLLAAVDDKKPRKEAWEAFLDDPAVKAYAEQVKAGTLDAAARDTLLSKVLPLLEAPANRRSLERLRRRIRDVMLNERATAATTLDSANAAAADWLLQRARGKDIDPAAAINEVLLVGDLRGADGKPWPGSLARLATTAADAGASLAVRTAALAGVVRSVEAGVTASPEAITAIRTVAFTPPSSPGPAADWLTARAIGLLPAMLPKAPADVAAELGKVMGDVSRGVDVRVRAAEALGRTVSEESKIDATSALTAVRATAIRGLEQDLARAKELEFGQSLAAGGAMVVAGPGYGAAEFAPGQRGEFGGFPGRGPGMGPGMGPGAGFPGMAPGPGGAVAGMTSAPPVEPTVIEHNAWRLFALSAALQPPGKGGGLAGLAGENKPSAEQLARKLRDNSIILHEWIYPPKDEKRRRQPVGPEAGFETGMMNAQPTKQDLGQTLQEVLDDLRATPAFGPDVAPAAATPADPPAAAGSAPASGAADPFSRP